MSQTRVRQEGRLREPPRRRAGLGRLPAHHHAGRSTAGRPTRIPTGTCSAFNATRDPAEGGRIKAADFANIYRDRPYYEAACSSRWSRRIRGGSGWPVERRAGGKWGLAGLQPLGAPSPSAPSEIEEEARRLNITDPGRKAGLGAKTRAEERQKS